MKRIKTITSHAGVARFLAECEQDENETLIPRGYLARGQVEEIPSPYQYSPSTTILNWNGRDVIYFETSHRRYEVFEVPANLLRFKTDQEATDWHIRFCVKH